MNPENQTISAENLRQIRKNRGMNQTIVGEVIGLTAPQVSQIENGIRSLSPSEKSLLELFFFGTIPKGVAQVTRDIRSILEFTEDEWRVIEILAKRAGLPAEKWIASKIREYLTWNEEARGVAADRGAREKKALAEKTTASTFDEMSTPGQMGAWILEDEKRAQTPPSSNA